MGETLQALDQLIAKIDQKEIALKEIPISEMMSFVKFCYDNSDECSKIVDFYTEIINEAIQNKDEKYCIKVIQNLKYEIEAALDWKMKYTDALAVLQTNVLKEKRDEKLSYNAMKYYQRKCKPNEKNIFRHKRGVIYTAITGGYDSLKKPQFVNENYDYICFTDNKDMESDFWKIRYIEDDGEIDKVRLARKYKILGHKYLSEYDYSIWIDGKIMIIGDVDIYIEKYCTGRAMLCFPHFLRDCMYQEAMECIGCQKDNSEVIRKQIEKYIIEGYPEHNGLEDTGCIVRMHTDEKLKETMELWWNEVRNFSRRDQLSFDYACWKTGFEFDISDLFIYKNNFVKKDRDWESL